MLDPIVWAAGILAITKRIKVFTTVHTPFVHPIVMAKHLATRSTASAPGASA